MGRKVCRDPPDHRVSQVKPGHKENRANPDSPVRMGRMGSQDRKGRRVRRENPDRMALR